MKQTDAVRQILMNELGLTRETVRTEMKAIIDEAVEREVKRLISQGEVRKIVESCFSRLVTPGGYWEPKSVVELVLREARSAAREWVQKHIKLDITVIEPQPKAPE